MDKSPSPELWLTPLIGLIGLAVYVFWHDNGHLGFVLRRSAIPATLMGILPLFVTALAQSYFRRSNWPIRRQILTAGFIGCVLVGVSYFIAAPHYDIFFPHSPNDAEGWGNDVAIIQYEAPILGMVGALATVISTLLSSGLRPKY